MPDACCKTNVAMDHSHLGDLKRGSWTKQASWDKDDRWGEDHGWDMGDRWGKSDSLGKRDSWGKHDNRCNFHPYRNRKDYYNYLYNDKLSKFYNHKANYYYLDSNKFYKFWQYSDNFHANYYEDTFWQWCGTTARWVPWFYDDRTSV